MFNEAELAALMGDVNEAERNHARAVYLWTQAFNSDHPYVARGDSMPSQSSRRRGRPGENKWSRRTGVDDPATFGDAHPHVAWTLTNIAATAAENGDIPRALRNIRPGGRRSSSNRVPPTSPITTRGNPS